MSRLMRLPGGCSRVAMFVAALGVVTGAARGGCPSDTDGNGATDVDDLINVILAWGTDGLQEPGIDTDIDGSGTVDVDDLVDVVLGFGPCITPPTCTGVDSPYMTVSYDDLQSFVPFTGTPDSGFITWGLNAMDDAGTLLMHSSGRLWTSRDDGCSWDELASTDPAGLYRIAPGPSGTAYAWVDNGSGVGPDAGIYLVRNSPPGSETFIVAFRAAPVSAMHGFGVDPANPARIRTADNNGLIHESVNGGSLWTTIGVPASTGGFLSYVMAFDPNDLDHAVFGRSGEGAFVTFNGGQSWTQSTGLSSVPGSGNNFFNAVISPVDGNHVFAMGIDLGESLPPSPPSNGKHMYLSTDGGLTFTAVLSQGTGGGEPGEGVQIQNQPLIRASRDDANVFHYLHSVSPAFGGTTIYRYEAGVSGWTSIANGSMPKLRVFDISRVNPDGWLLGYGL